MANAADIFADLSTDFRNALDKCIDRLGDFDDEEAEQFGGVVSDIFETVLDDAIEQVEREATRTPASGPMRKVLPHEQPLIDDFFRKHGGGTQVEIKLRHSLGFTPSDEDDE